MSPCGQVQSTLEMANRREDVIRDFRDDLGSKDESLVRLYFRLSLLPSEILQVALRYVGHVIQWGIFSDIADRVSGSRGWSELEVTRAICLAAQAAARVNSRGPKPSEFERAAGLPALRGAHLRRLDTAFGLSRAPGASAPGCYLAPRLRRSIPI